MGPTPPEALSRPTGSVTPHEDAPLFRAMLEHGYGRLLVATRTGSRREAARWFKSAHDRFDALRAEPFLQRCETDLAAMGLTAPAHARQHVLALTERELSVAHLIAAWKDEPGGRDGALRHPEDRRVPLVEHLRQARHHLTPPPRTGAPDPAALTASQRRRQRHVGGHTRVDPQGPGAPGVVS